ncbi:MAG: aromatic ring-hydroxylating dioxygenase subunit alpha, partial [Pseudomonadota bacterium]
MERDEQIRVLKGLMAHIDAGTNVDAGGIRHNPAESYTSPDIATREWDVFFRSHPQIIGMSGDLPEANSFATHDDFGVPLLATRDSEGRFRAFANVCRHRGAIIEEAPRGKKKLFSCPFHAWTYSSQGALVAVPKQEQFGQIDKDCLGLVELPAEEHCGLLWVHPQADGQLDAQSLMGGLTPEFNAWDFSRMVHIGDDTYETPMNWKLAIDTFGETYHFSALHKNSLFPFFHGNVQGYDVFGRNHRMALCTRGIDDLRGQPEESWHIADGAFPVYYMFPNVQVNVGSSTVILVRVYPNQNDPHHSLSRITFYAWPAALAAGD